MVHCLYLWGIRGWGKGDALIAFTSFITTIVEHIVITKQFQNKINYYLTKYWQNKEQKGLLLEIQLYHKVGRNPTRPNWVIHLNHNRVHGATYMCLPEHLIILYLNSAIR